MFEQMTADIAYLNRQKQLAISKYYGRAYQPPPDRVVPKDYRVQGGAKLRPRGRHPAHTRFKRVETTIKRDQQALNLRDLGLNYEQIGRELGFSAQAAYQAVRRGLKDHLAESKKRSSSRVDKLPLTHTDTAMATPLVRFSDSPRASRMGNGRGRVFPLVSPKDRGSVSQQRQRPRSPQPSPRIPQLPAA